MKKNTSKLLIVSCFFITITGCSSTERSEVETPQVKVRKELFEPSPEQIDLAKNIVRNRLKDPESATFSDIYGVKNESLRAGFSICGKVNAKNSFGGYVGNKSFAVTGNNAVLAPEGGNFSKFDMDLLKDLCTPN